jgi:hypothetical protein
MDAAVDTGSERLAPGTRACTNGTEVNRDGYKLSRQRVRIANRTVGALRKGEEEHDEDDHVPRRQLEVETNCWP